MLILAESYSVVVSGGVNIIYGVIWCLYVQTFRLWCYKDCSEHKRVIPARAAIARKPVQQRIMSPVELCYCRALTIIFGLNLTHLRALTNCVRSCTTPTRGMFRHDEIHCIIFQLCRYFALPRCKLRGLLKAIVVSVCVLGFSRIETC
jgi:hypothetical protein